MANEVRGVHGDEDLALMGFHPCGDPTGPSLVTVRDQNCTEIAVSASGAIQLLIHHREVSPRPSVDAGPDHVYRIVGLVKRRKQDLHRGFPWQVSQEMYLLDSCLEGADGLTRSDGLGLQLLIRTIGRIAARFPRAVNF